MNPLIMTTIYLVGFLVVCALLLWAIVAAIYVGTEIYKDRRQTNKLYYLERMIGSLETWCSYEYPICKPIAGWLRNYITDYEIKDIKDLREQLRKEFPTEKP